MANTTRYRGLAFWLTAAALGAAFFHGPIAVWGRSVGATVAAGLALVALGVCFGYARPHRPWRWALAAVSLLPVIAAVQTIVLLRSESAGRLPPGSPAPGGFSLFVFWLVQIPIAIIPALPVLFGAYVGAFVKERLAPVTTRAARPIDRAITGIGGALGLVAGVPYVLSAHALTSCATRRRITFFPSRSSSR